MNEAFKVYHKKTTRNYIILFTSSMICIGVLLFLSGIGQLEWLHNYLQGANVKFAFIRYSSGQLIFGSVTIVLFGWVWFITTVNIFLNKPILVADDIGLEINRIAKHNTITWEYIDSISIENHAAPPSKKKRPNLVIRYRKKTATEQNTEILIPLSILANKPKNLIEALTEQNNRLKH